MTVHELRFRLSQLDGSTHVVVLWEAHSKSKTDVKFSEITGVTMSRGTPTRDAEGRGAFSLDDYGPANWVFITVKPA